MLKPISLFLAILTFLSCTENSPKEVPNLTKTKTIIPKQLVIVKSENPDAVDAQLSKYEFTQNKWQQVGRTHDVTLGRTGIANGIGHQLLKGNLKKEGDGKSPAGIFEFGTAFGYASKAEAPKFKLPYVPITQVTQCIEDSKSNYYNQIVDNSKVTKDWNTADFMRREDDLYKWGVFVKHNTPAKAEAGSCIFFHLWRGPGKHTAGCTAMTEENILNLITWLDPNKEPRLIQVTGEEYEDLEKVFLLVESI